MRAYCTWRHLQETVVLAATTYTRLAAIGEELQCDKEPNNSCDRYSEESMWQLVLLLVHDRSYQYLQGLEP